MLVYIIITMWLYMYIPVEELPVPIGKTPVIILGSLVRWSNRSVVLNPDSTFLYDGEVSSLT